MRPLAILACTAMAMLAILPAHAQTHVELMDTWPSDATTSLAPNQKFYLRLQYQSDRPVHIWARPYFHGEPADAGSNPSRTYPAGSGEALGWFFLSRPGVRVDEIRIRAGDGSIKRTAVVATYPVSLVAGSSPVHTPASPEWVTRLSAKDKAAQDAEYQKAMNQPITAGETLFFTGFMATMVALGLIGVAWPAWGLWRWRGGWRAAAAVPAIVMAFVILRIVVDGARDPTSHNLWPFEIVMWGGFSFVWMLVAGLVHKLSGAGRTS